MENNNYTFERYQDQWYIDLPEWEGPKDDLEMVMGADTLLDIMSEGGSRIKVKIMTEPFDGYTYKLKFVKEEFEGVWYEVESKFGNSPFECWLCAVTTFIFQEFPQEFYFKRVGIEF